MLNILSKFKHALIAIEKYVAISSLFLLLAFTLTQIIARNFFDTGFTSLETISRHLVLFIAFSGASLVCEQNNHIKIDVLSAFLSSSQKSLLIKPLLIISSVVCGIFSWHASRFWLDELSYAPAHELWIVYLALILPIGFATLSLHFLLISLTGFDHKPDYSES